ncbi:hypothetical protein D9M68_862540 [compost metagenome]
MSATRAPSASTTTMIGLTALYSKRGTWNTRSSSITGMYSSRTFTSCAPWATVLMSLGLIWNDSITEDSGRM